jgi:AGCS family alanine or glycine:cation symporter
MLDFLNDLLWGYVLIYGLVAAGLAFTIASRFVQFRYFGAMWGSCARPSITRPAI